MREHTPTAAMVVNVCLVMVALLGVSVVWGWYAHSVGYVQVRPEFVPMQFNTAVCFVLLAGAATMLRHGAKTSARVLGVTVAGASLLTIAEYVFGFNLGLDEVFIKHWTTVGTSHAGRMAPNTAIGFVLLSASLGVLPFRSLWSRRLAIAAGVVGAVSLLGYALKLPAAYAWFGVTGMAVHTSLGIVAMTVAVVAMGFCVGCPWYKAADKGGRSG